MLYDAFHRLKTLSGRDQMEHFTLDQDSKSKENTFICKRPTPYY